MNSGNWTPIADGGLLTYPAGAIVAETETTVLMASYPGRVVRINTTTGQQSLYADYSHLGELSAWGMARFPDGTLVLSDIVAGSVIRIKPDRTASLLSTGGLLNATWGIAALPDGNVAVGNSSRQGQDSIIRINTSNGSQSYITPPTVFPYQPNAMTVDLDGNLLVSGGQETTRGAIYKVRLSDGQVTPFSTDNQFANPVGIVVVQGTGVVHSLVPQNARWRYQTNGSSIGASWRLPAFDDSAWPSGQAELGYGDGDEATVVDCGPSRPTCNSQNIPTTYFRHEFQISDLSRVISLAGELVRDDAAAVYVNGIEVFRDSNLPAGAAWSFFTQTSNGENALVEFGIDKALLLQGRNVLAVEVHQSAHTSSDMSFSLRMRGVLEPVPEPATWISTMTAGGLLLILRRRTRFRNRRNSLANFSC